jgi:hypothetical protein
MITQNIQWKKNRNLYCMMLLDQLFSRKLSKPFIKMPPDDALPMLSQTEVVGQSLDNYLFIESDAVREI